MTSLRVYAMGLHSWIWTSVVIQLVFTMADPGGLVLPRKKECIYNDSSLVHTDWSGMIQGLDRGTKDCVWHIKVPTGNSIKVDLDSTSKILDGFNPGSHCVRHAVVVKAENSNSSTRFCLPSNMDSTTFSSNELEVSVISNDMLHPSDAFKLLYTTVCGTKVIDPDQFFQQEFEIPPDSEECTWTFDSSQPRRMALNIGSLHDWMIDIQTDNGTISTENGRKWWIYLNSGSFNVSAHRRIPTSNTTENAHEQTSPALSVQSLDALSPCPDVCGTNRTYIVCEPKDPPHLYHCRCRKGYKGRNCTDIAYTGPYCGELSEAVLDDVRIHWANTEVNLTDVQPCPQGRLGSARRPCLPDGKGGAVWGRPDLTGCVSQRIKDIENMETSWRVPHVEQVMLTRPEHLISASVFVKVVNTAGGLLVPEVDTNLANELKQQTTVDKDAIGNVTSGIIHATDNQDRGGTTLYPGDLVVSTDVVQTIAEVSSKSRGHHSELDEIAQGYGEAVSGLVDNQLARVWNLIELPFVENRMASILSSMATLAGNLAKVRMTSSHRSTREMSTLSQRLSINSTSPNLDFSVTFHERIAMCDSSFLSAMGDNSTSSILYPATVFRNAVKASTDPYIQIYSARFSSMSHILSTSQQEEEKHMLPDNKKISSKIINSDIMSGSVLNVPDNTYQHMDKPVIITMEIKNTSLGASLKENCVFMNMTEVSHERRWLTEGCVEDEGRSNMTHVVCVCNHMTNFAVMMDVFDVSKTIDDENSDILTYLSYGGGSFSVLCCIIAVIVFEYYRLRNDRIRTHEQLAIAIILVQVLFLAGIDRTENKYVCMSIAIALHYFLTAMFCWMLVEGFHLYVLLIKVFKRSRNFGKYLLVGWGVPIVITGISAGVFYDKYGNDRVCWLSRDMLLAVVVPTVGLVVVINTMVLLMVMRVMVRSIATRANSEDRSAVRAGLKAAVVLLPILGLTWTLGFLSVEDTEALIFNYLFILFNSLQGVFFFVMHCLLSVDVQKAYKRESRKKQSTSWTNFKRKGRKSSDQDTFYSNSKESVNTMVTDASSLDRKRQYVANGVDRIYRDPKPYDHYSSQVYFHGQLYRSRSDETSRPSFRRQKDSTDTDEQPTGVRFFRGQYSMKSPPKQESVSYHDVEVHAPGKEEEITPDTSNTEYLYSKPVKRSARQHSNSESRIHDNHVQFDRSISTDDDEVFNRDPIHTTPKCKSLVTRSVSGEDFLKELKERTASFRDN